MDISAFTFVRHAVRLDYPVKQAILAALPLVDEYVVNIGRLEGDEDDGTEELIRSIDSEKIRIIHSTWNPHVTAGGYIVAQQTNIALFNCQGKWAINVHCDEMLHEDDHELLRDAMTSFRDNANVDALTLWQKNFFGDYKTEYAVRPWTSWRKCWIVKPHHFVLSRGDGANFTVHPKYKERGRKIRAVETAARQFHYGEVRSIQSLQAKFTEFSRFYKTDANYAEKRLGPSDGELDLAKLEDELYYHKVPRRFVQSFHGTHPAVMHERIAAHPLKLDLHSPRWRTKLTAAERRLYLKGWLVDHTTDRFARPDYKLVGKHS